jgi:DNA-binding NtrC family response regulator
VTPTLEIVPPVLLPTPPPAVLSPQSQSDRIRAMVLDPSPSVSFSPAGFAAWLQGLAQDHPPEVILVTGYATREVAETALEQGAFAYVEKPFDVEDLVDRTKQALWRRHLSAVHERRARQEPPRSAVEG